MCIGNVKRRYFLTRSLKWFQWYGVMDDRVTLILHTWLLALTRDLRYGNCRFISFANGSHDDVVKMCFLLPPDKWKDFNAFISNDKAPSNCFFHYPVHSSNASICIHLSDRMEKELEFLFTYSVRYLNSFYFFFLFSTK